MKGIQVNIKIVTIANKIKKKKKLFHANINQRINIILFEFK